MSMAVIAMYAEQVERLRQALGRRRFKRPVKIDTVNSFEGREEDMVVISLVRSNERGRIGFLRVPNRLNVAISRAKHLVACIGDSATLRAGEELMYGELVEAARSTGGWLSALDIVSPGKPQRRRRGARRCRPRVGEDGQPLPATEGEDGRARRRRRRRRRGGRPDPGRAPGPGGSPVSSPPSARAAAARPRRGAAPPPPPPPPSRAGDRRGCARSGRSRRPRRTGRGVPGSLHFAPGGETQSFRPRRRRRRRGGWQAEAARAVRGHRTPPAAAPRPVELPPAATGCRCRA